MLAIPDQTRVNAHVGQYPTQPMYMLAIPDLIEVDPMSMLVVANQTQRESDKTRLDVHVGHTRLDLTRPIRTKTKPDVHAGHT